MLNNIKNIINFKIALCLIILGIAFAVLISPRVDAVAAEYSQSYRSDEALSFGSLVSLDENSESKIVLATTANVRSFLGVNIDDSGSTVAVNKTDTENQVAVNGNVIALASNVAGEIKKGDLLSVSVVSGVASKAYGTDNIIGAASTNFDSNNPKNSTTQITTENGTTKQVTIGPLEIELFRIQKNASSNAGLVGWIEKIFGKPVSTIKLVMVTIISLAVVGAIVSMSYSAIRTSISQASRNPLAQPIIMQVLAKVLFVIVVTTVVGASLILLVLKV